MSRREILLEKSAEKDGILSKKLYKIPEEFAIIEKMNDSRGALRYESRNRLWQHLLDDLNL